MPAYAPLENESGRVLQGGHLPPRPWRGNRLDSSVGGNFRERIDEIKDHHHGRDEAEVEAFLEEFRKASVVKKGMMLQQLKEHSASAELSKRERKDLKRVYKTELVKRSALMKIVAAWLITVPVSGLLAALLYFTIRGMMMP